jgi:hypothetical protein
MTNITVKTFDADYNEILDTQSMMQKIREFDAYQKANPKTQDMLIDDVLADLRWTAVANGVDNNLVETEEWSRNALTKAGFTNLVATYYERDGIEGKRKIVLFTGNLIKETV